MTTRADADPTDLAVHDNAVLGYQVEADVKRLTLHTELYDQTVGRVTERTTVTFEGVLGYHLQDGLSGILFSIEQVPFAHIAAEYRGLIAAGRRHGWPFQACVGDPHAFVAQHGAKTFRVQGSTAFDGFVVCATVRARTTPVDGRGQAGS